MECKRAQPKELVQAGSSAALLGKRLLLKYKQFLEGGITCGAIDEPRKSSKAIDERVIINFRDKNVIIARFCDINEVLFDLLINIYFNSFI